MKKIFFLLCILISFFAEAQPGYTQINARYRWLAGRFDGLHIPAFSTTPSLQTGQWSGSGAVGIDSILHRMYYYSGGVWRLVGTGSVGGSTTQVQYNNAGAFGGISGATTNGTVLTLTSPVINVTSDATGDVYYRNAGVFTRLPIGTTGQQLTVSGGGLPSWAASGGSTPTLDQVLVAGSTLTASRTINMGGLNILTINNGAGVNIQTVAGTLQGDYILQPNETTISVTDLATNARGTLVLDPASLASLTVSDGVTYTDSISLGGHDAIIKTDSIFFRDPSLSGASVGYVWTLQSLRGHGKWVAAGGGGGWGTTGTIATLTGNSTLDLDGSSLIFAEAGNNILNIAPGAGDVIIQAFNNTGGGNYGRMEFIGDAGSGDFSFIAGFNGVNDVQIEGFNDGTVKTLEYTADTHTFNGAVGIILPTGVRFNVNDGTLDLIDVNTTAFTTGLVATDGTATGQLTLNGNSGGSPGFNLYSDNGVNAVSVIGVPSAQTITLTATNGVIFAQQARLKNYTVATLPAGTAGDIAYVTDALLPSYLTTIAGGGAVVTPVFYDGTNWKAF